MLHVNNISKILQYKFSILASRFRYQVEEPSSEVVSTVTVNKFEFKLYKNRSTETMGSFIGHVIPGSFFIVFALWWMIDTLNCYFRPKHNRKQFESRLMQYTTCCQGRRQVSLMAWTIVITTSLGIIVEMILSPLRAKSTPSGGNIQHATMYFFFCLVGLQALILDHCPALPQRRQLEYMSVALALAIEALLFKFHLDGRTKVDIVMHTLILYVLYSGVIVTLIEMQYKSSVLLSLGRSYFMMLQGTWFMQLAFSLYSPWSDPWGHHLSTMSSGTPAASHTNASLVGGDTSSHGGEATHAASHHMTMKAASIFSWHVVVLLIVYVTLFLVGHKRYGHSKGLAYNTLRMEDGSGTYTEHQDEAEEELVATQLE
jgi:hypothetical protein